MNKIRWVFIRGLTRGNIHWGNFPETLMNANPNIEMDFLEIPGNGNLHHDPTPLQPVAVIEILRKKCRFVQENRPFHICGISLGGMIGLKWAELFPGEIQSVVLINSSLRQFSPFYHRLMAKNYLQIILAILNSNSSAPEKIILKITSNRFKKTQKFLAGFSEFSKNHPVSRLNFLRQLRLAQNIEIRNDLKTPLTVISSKLDRLVDSSCSVQIAHAFKCQNLIHPTAGHDLPLDEPEWLCQTLLRLNSHNETADQT